MSAPLQSLRRPLTGSPLVARATASAKTDSHSAKTGSHPGKKRTPSRGVTSILLNLDPSARIPLYDQIYHGLRDAIRSGRLTPGSRIPSTRVLAADLGVSRTTILLAIAQLTAEGYLESHSRSGTQVTVSLPDELLTVLDGERHGTRGGTRGSIGGARTNMRGAVRGLRLHGASAATPASAVIHVPTLGHRGEHAAAFIDGFSRLGTAPRPFRPGTPALDRFPTDVWAKLATRRYRRLSFAMLDHADPAGYGPLREAIAGYARTARGVHCEPEQVIITTGAQQALALTSQLLLDPGDDAWVEDPGYRSMRGALTVAGANVVAVPVNAEGIDVDAGRRLAPAARLAYTTPSHQFPLGVTMSHARRLALLAWADDANAWIVEDDYDSEYRYAGRPLPALQGLDTQRRVIYVGTFSKTLFPSLRIGYLIVPAPLIDAFTKARSLADGHASAIEQSILADFILEGHFARHIRRMRALYAERQEHLLAMAQDILGDRLSLSRAEAGLHLIGWLPRGVSDEAVSAAAAARGIEAPALARYYQSSECRQGGLLLGYASLDDVALADGLRVLADVIPTRPR